MTYIINLDYKIFILFNSWAGIYAWFDLLIILLAHYAVYFLAFGLVAHWFAGSDILGVRKRLILVFISLVSARYVVVEAIRYFFPRSRPFSSHLVVQLIAKGQEQSFPSGHAAALFAIAMSVYFYNKRLGGWLFLFSTAVAISRVIAGVHYPSDVVAGAIIGIICAYIVEKTLWAKIGSITPKISAFSDRLLPFTKR